MNLNRRAALKIFGAGTLATSAFGLATARAAAQDVPVPLTLDVISPYLSASARDAATNKVPSCIWQQEVLHPHPRHGLPMRVCSPAWFLTQRFYNDGMPRNHVPLSFAKRWANMLNVMASHGWGASLASVEARQLVDARSIQSVGHLETGVQLWRKLFNREPTAEELRPTVAVFSFIHFKWRYEDPFKSFLRSDRAFNERFGTNLSQLEGRIPGPKEFRDFKFRA